MGNCKGETGLEEVHYQTKNGLEQECGNQQSTKQDQKSLWRVDAQGTGQVKGTTEVRRLLNGVGLHHEADDRDDDCQTKNFHQAVDKNAQQQKSRAFLFTLVEKAEHSPECAGNGISLVQRGRFFGGR